MDEREARHLLRKSKLWKYNKGALQTGQQTNIGLVYVTQALESAPSSASPYSFQSAGVTSASAPSSASPYSFPCPYLFPSAASYSPGVTAPWFNQQTADPTDHGRNLFRLAFITGNISVCYGCQNRYVKDAGPPHDLCILHGEMRSFSTNGVPQSRLGNAYYHVHVDCVRRIWPTFMLLIVHKAFLN